MTRAATVPPRPPPPSGPAATPSASCGRRRNPPPVPPRSGPRGGRVGLGDLVPAALAGAFLGLGHPLHVIGRNWGFRRDLWAAAGGWGGLEGTLSGDDTLLAQKLAR